MPEFIYFDMGNVLLYFSHEKMAEQMAQVVGIPSKRAWKILFDESNGLEWAYERGELTREQFYSRFCEVADTRADINVFDVAGSDIFEINAPMCGLASQLASAGYRLGVCSNTSPSHWGHCVSRYRVLSTAFAVHALSFHIGAIKPDQAFFAAAAQLTGVSPNAIFFLDDRPDNVAAAKAASWDAVLYTSASQVNEELCRRGFVTNY